MVGRDAPCASEATSLIVLDLNTRDLWLLDDARVFGGGQWIVLRLATFLRDSDAHIPRVICPADSELADRCRAAEIQVRAADFPDLDLRGLRILAGVRKLREVLRPAGEGSVVVASSLRTQVYAHASLIGRRRPPSVVHFMVEQDSARRLLARLLLRHYGAVVVVGDAAAAAYSAGLAGTKVHTVNNFLSPGEILDAARRPRPSLDGRVPVLGVLARLIPAKGVLELVDELADDPSAWSRLVIGGDPQDGTYVRALDARIRDRGFSERVSIMGRIDDLAAFFAGIDVLVVPSTGYEGQPTVILEALTYGRPCIVRDALRSDAFAEFPVLAYSDSSSLATALRTLPAAEASRESLLRHFSPAHAVAALEAAAREPSPR